MEMGITIIIWFLPTLTLGPCTSCNNKGYIIVEVDNNDAKKICSSCKTAVDEIIAKNDLAGENRTWCKECWSDYDAMLER